MINGKVLQKESIIIDVDNMRQYYKSKKVKKEKSFQRSVKELIIVCAISVIINIMLLVSIMF